jgi:nicotinate-nucleotide adenylyltransferase
MRLGIFGGTFDPVHYGHLLLAETCREQLALDAVWFLPAAVPPHKRDRPLTPGAQRIEMLELAIGGDEKFLVCPLEIDRGGVNYTVDTLAQLKTDDPTRELFFLLGADSLRDLHTWKEPARLCELATLVVVQRAADPGTTAADAPMNADANPELIPITVVAAAHARRVQMPRVDLSSSDIRSRLAAGHSIRYQTPRAVEKYIETHGLYAHPAG